MGVKKLIVRTVFLDRELERLRQKYLCTSIFLPGSPRHKKAGLDKDHVLIQAWQKRKGGES